MKSGISHPHFNDPPEELIKALQGGAIYEHWQAIGGMNSVLGAPTSPEDDAEGGAPRYATFAKGAMYWSPDTGTQPVTGAIYEALGLAELRTRSERTTDERGNTRAPADHPELPAR